MISDTNKTIASLLQVKVSYIYYEKWVGSCKESAPGSGIREKSAIGKS